MILGNAKNITLDNQTGTLPNVSDALMGWMQPMTFGVVTKTVVNFQVVETMTEINFQGVMQPLQAEQLMMKPEGQQSWNWQWLHADPSLVLTIDQVINYRGTQYRVMAFKPYDSYGYREYELVQDYTGSGPEVEP
jgi:hypothetical protein